MDSPKICSDYCVANIRWGCKSGYSIACSSSLENKTADNNPGLISREKLTVVHGRLLATGIRDL